MLSSHACRCWRHRAFVVLIPLPHLLWGGHCKQQKFFSRARASAAQSCAQQHARTQHCRAPAGCHAPAAPPCMPRVEAGWHSSWRLPHARARVRTADYCWRVHRFVSANNGLEPRSRITARLHWAQREHPPATCATPPVGARLLARKSILFIFTYKPGISSGAAAAVSEGGHGGRGWRAGRGGPWRTSARTRENGVLANL